MLVLQYIARFLEERGLDQCFGLSGANIEDLFFEIHKEDKVKIILAKTEYAASMMALGQYLANKKIPVVMTTSGPGILNTIPVLAEAFSSDLPMVLISGLIPQGFEGRGGFQDSSGKGRSLKIEPMVREVTGFCHIINSADEIPRALHQAFLSAESTKKPSAIFIPKNIFLDSLQDSSFEQAITKNEFVETGRVLSLLQRWECFTEAPVVILGEKLVHLKSLDKLNRLLEKLGAYVALTPNAKGFYDHRNPKYLGITGVMGNDEVIEHLTKNENVIIIGSELDMLSRFGLEPLLSNKNLFVLSEVETSISSFVNNSKIYCEINGNLELLISSIEEKFDRPPVYNKSQVLQSSQSPYALEEFSFKGILSQFSKIIETDANVFADAGNTGAFVIHDLILSGKTLFYVFLGMGGMGNSIGACIGSAIGNKRRSYAFMGDGSFLMYGLEIHTAVELGLPVVFIVFNNNSHAMCSTREDVFLGKETGLNNFKQSFLGKGLEQMFPGLQTFDISTQEELVSCLSVLPKIEKPTLISLNVSQDEKPPFRSFYKS